MLHVDLETLEGSWREALEAFRQREAVVFLENGLPVGVLTFLSSSPPGPGVNSGGHLARRNGEESS